jgi:TonB family protein
VLRHAALALLLALPAGATAAPQDSIAAARDLYTTAGYDEALAMLTRLRAGTTEPAEVRTIDQYRVFALFALGRTQEAEQVVEGMALLDPLWVLPRGEAPPRIEALFAAARTRALPGVVRQRLGAARVLYAEKRYAAAAEAFTGVLTLLEDPAVAQATGTDAAPFQALATGFRDLSLAADEQARAAAAKAPEPTGAAAQGATAVQGDPPLVPEPATPAPAEPATTQAARTEPGPAPTDLPATPPAGPAGAAAPSAAPVIVPPVVIAQVIPRPSDISVPMGSPQTILMDIVIDENGRVERAEIRKSVDRLYETQLVAATRGWRYRPATQNGRPVKYLRTLEVTLNPRQ